MRFCSEPGCAGTSETERFCQRHEGGNYRTQRDRARKQEETSKWYGRSIWRRKLQPMKLSHNPICERCGNAAATVVHHKDGSWRDGGAGAWSLFVDLNNLESCCKACHDSTTMTDLNKRRFQ